MHVQLNGTHSSSELKCRVFVFFAFIFSLEYSIYLVSSILLDSLIKISSLALLMLFALKPSNRINTEELILLFCYLMLFSSATLPTLLSVNTNGILIIIKYLYMFMILPVLLVCYRSFSMSDNFLISTFMVIGVLFSVQAIVASMGVYSGLIDITNITRIQRYSNMETVNFGVWGFGNAIQSPILDFKILRPQGWFLEPSKLASFLLLPAFVSIGRYQESRKKIYFLSAFLIFMAILLTLSLAGYFAVVCTVLLLLFSKYFYRNLKKIPVIKYTYAIPIFLIFFGVAFSLLNLTYVLNDIDQDSVTENQALVSELLARDKDGQSGNLVREIYKSDNYINVLKDSPLGVGFDESKSSELRSGNAFLFWFSAGGIPAVLAIIILFGYIFLIFCHPLLISQNAVFNAVGASFIGHSIQNLSYGNWIEPYFLIHLAIVVMSAKKAKMGIV
jgi:hypothetical protein